MYTMKCIQFARYTLLIFVGSLFVGAPAVFAAQNDLEVSGWIPYWQDSLGIRDAKKHLSDLDVVYPFAYTVTTKGELRDQAGLDESKWKNFIKTAHRNNTEIIPTVMWSDGSSIHTVLSSTTTRAAHISQIVDMVKNGKYDGVDIDYEGKKSETINYFSQFLKELKAKLGSKVLTCTVEARTPPDSLYKVVPATIAYANDYTEIGTHCDRVEIMAYDQQRADLKLNTAKMGEPYMPVADADWVRKVIVLALESIPKEKIILGIPTYGRHWTLTVAPDWYKGYERIGALNLPDILDIAKEYKVTPTRNRSGEMSFTYIPKSSDLKLSKTLAIPRNTTKGNTIAARALAYANKTGQTVTVNLVWYSDALAVKQKVDLAKEYSLRGVALFKIDGEEDQKLWKYLK